MLQRFAEKRCPECLVTLVAPRADQLFCCPAHSQAWHNRWTTRGRAGATLLAVQRLTRGGTRAGAPPFSQRASQDADALLRQWLAEDRAAEPPRMDVREYIARRYAAGHGSL